MKLTNLNTKYLGRNFIFYEKIDSTQNEIFRMIENCKLNNKKMENGTIVMSDIQENGKGTHGRKWFTDEKNNIAFSVYIETNCLSEQLENITTKIAEILVLIFKDIYNIQIDIKLPNDLYIKQKKIGGILTEARVELSTMNQNAKEQNEEKNKQEIKTNVKIRDQNVKADIRNTKTNIERAKTDIKKIAYTKYLVIGIGINTSKTTFGDEIKSIATSIKNEYNVEIDRSKIVSEFCNRFEKIIIDKTGR